MLNKRVEEAINAQINAEMWSAYLYLSMSAWFHANGNPGFAKWYEVQFKEEQDHAMILFKYITSRGGVVKLEKQFPPSGNRHSTSLKRHSSTSRK